MTPATFRVLDAVADAYDPLLTLLALLAPLLSRPRRASVLLRYYLAAALGIAVVYLVRAVDGSFGLWNTFGFDYSTHVAFAASLVVSLGMLFRRWLVPLGVSLAAYFVLILVLRYHGPVDMLSAAFVASGATYLAHRSLNRRCIEANGC